MGKQINTSKKGIRTRGDLSIKNRILPLGWASGIVKGLEYILPHVSISLGVGKRAGIKVRI